MLAAMQTLPKIIILIIGLLLVIIGFYGLNDVLSPLYWKKVNGNILLSSIITKEDYDLEKRIIQLYSLEMEYEYIIDDRRYRSDKITRSLLGMGHIFGNTSSAGLWGPYQIWNKRYPKGACVNVYVNPNNPRDAVLERIPVMPLISVILCMLVGLGLIAIVVLKINIPYLPISNTLKDLEG